MRRLIWLVIMGLMVSGVASAQESIDINYGESYVGTFTNAESSITLGFEATAGDVIYVTVLDEFVPVEYTLFSPGGGQLVQATDNTISNIELSADGRYTVALRRPEWSQDEGEFTVLIDRFAFEDLIVEDEGTALFHEGNLPTQGALKQFQFDATEGEFAMIQLYAATGLFEIFSPSNARLRFEGAYNDPAVPVFRFPMTGTYTLSIQTMEFGGTDYGIYLFKRAVQPIAVNEPISGQLDENLPMIFAFDAVADKMWDISAILPPEGDRTLSIYFFDDTPDWDGLITEDYGSGPDGQPRIRPFIAQFDGTFYVVLWYDNWNTESDVYDFTLTVSPSTLLSIPPNSPLRGETNAETGIVQYAFTGTAGEQIRVTFTKLSEDGALALNLFSQEDEVFTFMGRNATASTFDIELPLDGFYEFVIFNVSYDFESTLEYEILVESLSE